MQNIKSIEAEVKSHQQRDHDKKADIKEYLADTDKRALLEKTKELYKRLPRDRDTIFNYALQWNLLLKHDLFERVARPWIGKKVREYMGVEEPAVVQHIMRMLNARPTPDKMRDKVRDIMDEKTTEFVEKLWLTLIFEEMKANEGFYNNSS